MKTRTWPKVLRAVEINVYYSVHTPDLHCCVNVRAVQPHFQSLCSWTESPWALLSGVPAEPSNFLSTSVLPGLLKFLPGLEIQTLKHLYCLSLIFLFCVSVTLRVFISHQFCFCWKTCVAGLGIAFLFVYIGSGCLATSEEGRSEEGSGRGSLERSELDSLCLFSSVGGAPRGPGKIYCWETATSLAFLLYSPSLYFFLPFLVLHFSF